MGVVKIASKEVLSYSSFSGKVSNERVRTQTQLEKIDLIIKETRLRWLGHVL